MFAFEDVLYQIIGVLSQEDLPLVFKGALVLKAACPTSAISRSTSDIDCDWIGDPPSTDDLEKEFNKIMSTNLPEISFVKTRDYIVGKKSAGFDILKNGLPISKIDLSISTSSPSRLYSYAEIEFVGYDLINIVADKTSVLSSNKIFRRTKDFVDMYMILVSNNINKSAVLDVINTKNRQLGNFDDFHNRIQDLAHAYELLKGVINKPDFDTVYHVLTEYVNGFSNSESDLIWDKSQLKWIK